MDLSRLHGKDKISLVGSAIYNLYLEVFDL